MRTTYHVGAAARCTGPWRGRRCAVSGRCGKAGHQLRVQGQSCLERSSTGEQASFGRCAWSAPTVGYYSQALVNDMRSGRCPVLHRRTSSTGPDERRAGVPAQLEIVCHSDYRQTIRPPAAAPSAAYYAERIAEIAIRRKPSSVHAEEAPEVACMMFKPKSWSPVRDQTTPIVDKDDQQLYRTTGSAGTSSGSEGEQLVAGAGVANRAGAWQPGELSAIKDFKYGLVLAQPTGMLAANQADHLQALLGMS